MTTLPTMNGQVKLIADLCVDILIRDEVSPVYGQTEQVVRDYALEIGGSGAIFAHRFSQLGGMLEVYGLTGTDLFGEYISCRLEELRIPAVIRRSETLKTALGLGLIKQNDRAMLTYPGTLSGMDPGMILSDDFFKELAHLHIVSYFLLDQFRPVWPEIIQRAREAGATISLDTNWAPLEDWKDVHELLPRIDLFLPNEEEACRIAGLSDVEEAGRWLATRCPLVIVKCGSKGCRAFTKNTECSCEVDKDLLARIEIQDSTGAGDNFDAGFLSAWLQHRPLMDCMQLAVNCGTISLATLGGICQEKNNVLTTNGYGR